MRNKDVIASRLVIEKQWGGLHEAESFAGRFIIDFHENRAVYLWRRVCHDWHD